MPDRIPEYRDLLLNAQRRGYVFLTMTELASVARGLMRPPSLALVLRNDVDTDISTARLMFETERELGITSTYYFRLSTLDESLIRDMINHGTEVGYHFEEVATFAKRLGLRNSADVESNMESIRAHFRQNIEWFKSKVGSFPRTVASHGDFCNRVLHITNSCIIDDDIRREYDIIAEVYDEWLISPVTLRLSDTDAPKWWVPFPLSEALAENPTCLYLLVHPRQWRANSRENFQAEVIRLAEGAWFFIARAIKARAVKS